MLASIPWEEYLLVETFNVGEENCTILSCYNYRMAQPTQWVPAILDYMKKVR